MPNKKTRVTYRGINQDISKSKYSDNQYYSAENMKLTPVEGQMFGSISNSYGNKLAISIPIITRADGLINGIPYTNAEIDALTITGLNDQEIIGDVNTRDGSILFTTNDAGLDCIWEIPNLSTDPLDIKLLYIRDLNFSKNRPIQPIFNYENSKIQKVFWVDGSNYLRFLNKEESIANGFEGNLIDIPSTAINSKSEFNISQPKVVSAGGGGSHTAGVVQYSYTLYNLNGAETSLSPISDLFPLDKGQGLGGGDVNENVGSMPVVQIENLDDNYSFIKLYSIKYTEYNGTPSITLIYDGSIGNHTKFTFNDIGTKNLGNVSTAEFLFLGADPIKPKHIAAKDNILFASNNESTAYKLDIDTRAFSYNETGDSALVYSDVVYDIGNPVAPGIPYNGTVRDAATYSIPEDFDAVNLDFDTYRYISGITPTTPETFLDKATFNLNRTSKEGETYFNAGSGSEQKLLSVSCSAPNTSPAHINYELVPPASAVTSGNWITIPETGYYSFTFNSKVIKDNLTTQTGLVITSIYAYVSRYNGIGGALIDENELVPVNISGIGDYEWPPTGYDLNGANYNKKLSCNVGEVFKVYIRIGYGFEGPTCPYNVVDPDNNVAGFYEPTEPPIGSSETDVPVTMYFEDFKLEQVSLIPKTSQVAITPTFGETVIDPAPYIINIPYTGIMNINFVANTNMGGDPITSINYKLSLYKNNILVDSVVLGVDQNISQSIFSKNISYIAGDELQLILTAYGGEAYLQYIQTIEGWNFNLFGEITCTEVLAATEGNEGGTGEYISYELLRSTEEEVGLSLKEAKFFKDNEIYRIGILFYNSIGQASEAKWIADFKAPQGNLEGFFNTLKVTFSAAFYSYIAGLPLEDRPTSYSILRALRTPTDKTIITQGLLTGMCVQVLDDDYAAYDTNAERAAVNKNLLKVPIPLTRGYGNGGSGTTSYYPIYPTKHNKTMNERLPQEGFDNYAGNGYRSGDQDGNEGIIVDEIYRDTGTSAKNQQTWQFTKMIQMHSPEAAFNMALNLTDTDELVILGTLKRDTFEFKDEEINFNTLAPGERSGTGTFIDGTPGGFYPRLRSGFGVIGPSYRTFNSSGNPRNGPSDYCRRLHTHKTFYPLVRKEPENSYEIYGTPEISEVGHGILFYNNDSSLKYTNKLTSLVSDEKKGNGDIVANAVESVNSEGNRCITLVLGDSLLDTEDRLGLEDLYNDIATGEWDVELFAEIRRSKEYIYSGALYNGYDVYSRALTEYITIGDVQDIVNNEIFIPSPGDTFVQTFKNTRLTRVPSTTYTKVAPIIVETLDYLSETTVNLEERNDLSIGPWGKLVDPFAEEANKYNKVYSTDVVVRTYTEDNLKIREVNQFETQIVASKTKIPGEFIESWVDFRPNEVMYLDGKYGPVNALVSHDDELYTFQDFGIARIGVNPRVQVQGQDDVTIELGSGSILHDYTYLTTKVGSINKWGIVSANSGIFFIDSNTKQAYKVQNGNQVGAVSDVKGLHTFFYNNIKKGQLQVNNPIIGYGIAAGYDSTNGDIYYTIKDIINGDYTVAFNEKLSAFTSFYDFTPSRYIVLGDKMYTVNPDNNELWLHYDGDYQEYYGDKYEASITLLINTDDVHAEKVFNSIEFDSEVTLDGVDVDTSTIDSIEGWTDYQNSGKIPLIVGESIKRRMRTWKAHIPRQSDSRARLRDKWLFLKLGFNPLDNEKLILHDMIVGYSQHN